MVCMLPNVVRVVKKRKFQLAGHVAGTGVQITHVMW
jgi:hypothetical protein